ncbi:ATP-binding cassette multidrug transporter pdr12, partial [Zygosaccharomyces mellis]
MSNREYKFEDKDSFSDVSTPNKGNSQERSSTNSMESYRARHQGSAAPSGAQTDAEYLGATSQISRHLANMLSNDDGTGRLAAMSRVISTKTRKEMQEFEMNELDFDLKSLLGYLRSHAIEQGLTPSDSGIAFRNVTAAGIDASASYGPSVEGMFRDSLKWPLKFLKFGKKDSVPLRDIIRNCTGVVESGEMLFVVGRPGAGCSTLLKCLSGETGDYIRVEGSFSYDGLDQQEMMNKYKGYSIYCSEMDFHFPKITVKETIDFALKCKTPRVRVD